MKDKKTKKFLKAAKKLIKKIRKHGKDGEVLLLEIKKLLEPGKAVLSNKKAVKKGTPKKSPAKKSASAPKADRPAANPPEPGNAPLT